MSLSWLERLRLDLHPDRVILQRHRLGRLLGHTVRPVTPVQDGEADWQPAVAAARSLLAETSRPGASLSIVLADPYIRYGLLPWSEAVLGDKARRAVAEALLRSRFGEAAAQLTLTLDKPVFGHPGLAAGVSTAFLEELRSAAAQARLRLVSVQPGLQAALTGLGKSRQAINDGCLLFETGAWQLLLGLQDGRLAFVRNHRAAPEAPARQQALLGLLAAEASQLARRLYVRSDRADDWPAQLGDWPVSRLATPGGVVSDA